MVLRQEVFSPSQRNAQKCSAAANAARSAIQLQRIAFHCEILRGERTDVGSHRFERVGDARDEETRRLCAFSFHF